MIDWLTKNFILLLRLGSGALELKNKTDALESLEQVLIYTRASSPPYNCNARLHIRSVELDFLALPPHITQNSAFQFYPPAAP
jgi:hypothetical protein